ncbi:hypothetical protein HNQ81_002424 [Desulfoprunum benzoelyticum]|uniref:Uncharacterized protein n=1 Tax=Desulfoprunum benzoelyticum TaxID=1506996 RepID=A0A840UZ09_9BACT|nr:hypothetical protein [Desulfoprunum benzoelyticum]
MHPVATMLQPMKKPALGRLDTGQAALARRRLNARAKLRQQHPPDIPRGRFSLDRIARTGYPCYIKQPFKMETDYENQIF